MNYLSAENISRNIGERWIFKSLFFGLQKGEKVALIGKNGTGKTSLLNILSGIDTPDKGAVVYRKNLTVAFLSQEPNLNKSLTIEQTILASDNPVLEVIKSYEKAILHPEQTENYQAAFDAMDAHDAWDFETRYKQILFKLKLENLNKKVGDLSGGQKKRLALANALLTKPDLLVMDEPTNHLDLEMIEWLEALFAKENFTLFMVTHDRYFLERVCNEIVELDQGNLYSYKGNYSYYLEKKAERLNVSGKKDAKLAKRLKDELEWVRSTPKAKQTKSKARLARYEEMAAEADKMTGGDGAEGAQRRIAQKRTESLAALKQTASISEAAAATEEAIVFVQKQSVILYVWAAEKAMSRQLTEAVAAAFNAAVREAEEVSQQKMGKLTAGLPPGMKLPF